MDLKEILNKEYTFKPLHWVINLKRYISFNLFSLIGWVDAVLFMWAYILNLNPDNYYLWDFYLIFGLYYILISRTIALILLGGFITEKILKFEIKPNIITDNINYKIFFLLGLLAFTVSMCFILYLFIY